MVLEYGEWMSLEVDSLQACLFFLVTDIIIFQWNH